MNTLPSPFFRGTPQELASEVLALYKSTGGRADIGLTHEGLTDWQYPGNERNRTEFVDKDFALTFLSYDLVSQSEGIDALVALQSWEGDPPQYRLIAPHYALNAHQTAVWEELAVQEELAFRSPEYFEAYDAYVRKCATYTMDHEELIAYIVRSFADLDITFLEQASEEFTLARYGQPPIVFDGEELATDSERPISRTGYLVDRWSIYALYRTTHHKLVLAVENHSKWDNESTRKYAFFGDNARAVFDAAIASNAVYPAPAEHERILDLFAQADIALVDKI